MPALPLVMLFGGAAGIGYTADAFPLDGVRALIPGSGCAIKGNISLDTGERIYHVPGQRHYRETVVSLQKGERWFCSEAEARKAGWRRSQV